MINNTLRNGIHSWLEGQESRLDGPKSHNHVPVKGYPARVKCQVLL